ncbi:MAG: OmpA family protein [Myxococcota bacterium]
MSSLLPPVLMSALGFGLMLESAHRWEQDAEPAPPEAPVATPEPSRTPPPAPPPPSASPALRCPPLPSLFFARASANLRPEDQAALGGLATWLEEHQSVTVSVDGFADGVGAEESNLLLSHRRAQAAKDALERAGVSHARIVVRALGTTRPDAEGTHERRVDIGLQASGLECRSASAEGT